MIAGLLVAIVGLIVFALGVDPAWAAAILTFAVVLTISLAAGWALLERWEDGRLAAPERSDVVWALWLLVMFVVLGGGLLLAAISRGVAWLVGQIWRAAVVGIVAAVWMAIVAAVAGPTAPLSVLIGWWLISGSLIALTWWGSRVVIAHVTALPRWQTWRRRRAPIHQQPELLERMERLRS